MISTVRYVPSHLMMAMSRDLITTTLIIVSVLLIKPVDSSKSYAELANNSGSRVESLVNSNFLVGIADRAVKTANESSQVQVQECAQQLKTFLNAVELNEIWAIKLIDSFGTIPRSFVWGNNFWFSSVELCTEIGNPFYISLAPSIPRAANNSLMTSTSPYKMHLQMVYFNFTSPLQLDVILMFQQHIAVGLCMPDACTETDVAQWAKEYFNDQEFSPQITYDVKMTSVHSKLVGFSLKIFSKVGFILLVMIFTGILLLTILAEVVFKLQSRRQEVNKVTSKEEHIYGEHFIMCFSLRQNYIRVQQATAPKDFIPVIAGIRTIVCLWVTVFHIYYHSMFTRDNSQFLYAKLEGFILQPIVQSCFYVDVFFTISGFLLVYNLLSNVKYVEEIRSNTLSQNIQLYIRFALNRHFRLMPIFIITIIASDFFFDLIDMMSPFFMSGENDLYCKETWWYNLFYINNAVPLRSMCSSWGWYIACEMQFYLIFLAISFIYVKCNAAGKIVFSIAALGVVTTSYYCYYVSGITFQVDVISTTVDSVYTKPWTRITPYFSGAFMGWLLHGAKDRTLKLGKFSIFLFWCASVMIYFASAFVTYWKNTPTWLVSGIMSVGKLLFGIFIGSIIGICQLGYGGAFATVMGSKCFLYLNKFSFSVYMIAPVVISGLFGLRAEATKFNELASISDIFSVIIVTYFVSFLTNLFVEIPLQRLSSRYILKRS